MLSVEHKSALLVSSIVCVASGGFFWIGLGFLYRPPKIPATDFLPNDANIKRTGVDMCLFCPSFHFNASKGSQLEAPLSMLDCLRVKVPFT